MTGIRRCRVGLEKPTPEQAPTAGPLEINAHTHQVALVALDDIVKILAAFPPPLRRWILQAVSSCLAMEE